MPTKTETRLWDVSHSVDCETGNYYKALCHDTYDSWGGFLHLDGGGDARHHLLFRWTWERPDDDNGSHRVSLFFMDQDKARNRSVAVTVSEEDEPRVRAYLQARWRILVEFWAPVSD